MKDFYNQIDTPALLIDKDIAFENIKMMQKKADELGVALRPHIKTHRMTFFAKEQVKQGATGIACAKIGEAEVMAAAGTYIFFDLGQASAINDFSHCAATVLGTVISKPTKERVVLDTGAKALVSQNRAGGICSTGGFGYVKGSDNVRIGNLFDEHGLIYNEEYSKQVQIGDKVEIIPSHVCPTVNLYDEAYLISGDEILGIVPVDCRGKSK